MIQKIVVVWKVGFSVLDFQNLKKGKKIIEFNIGNYYGNLQAKQEGDKYYWGIEDYDRTLWKETPQYLYLSLEEHHKSMEQWERKE